MSLDGSASFDADGDPITFEWSFALRPINSAATLTNVGNSRILVRSRPRRLIRCPVAGDRQLRRRERTGLATIERDGDEPAAGDRSRPVTTPRSHRRIGYDVNATDPDVGDVLTFSLTTAPAGMTIDPASGLIAWTPAANQAGPQPVGVRVQDAGGLFATQNFTIQVSSPGNGAAVAVDDALQVRVSASR